jgi:hypothetical protein
MNQSTLTRVVYAFVAALVVATLWGSIVQTQFNLNALANLGVDITIGVRTKTTISDIFSGFSLTYGSYVVLPSLFFAFAAAWFISRNQPRHAALWFAAAGAVGVLLGNPVVNYLSPLPLLVGATRDTLCLILMALGGGAAGVVFISIARHVSAPLRLPLGYRQSNQANQAKGAGQGKGS